MEVPRRVGGVAGQLVGPFILRVAVVALDPDPFDPVRARGIDQFNPLVGIGDGLLRRIAPAILLPAKDPLGDAIDHIAAVGVEMHPARLLERAEGVDYGGEFHAVVGRRLVAARHFLFMVSHAQDRAPAAGAGVALAGAIGENLDRFQGGFWIQDGFLAHQRLNTAALAGSA